MIKQTLLYISIIFLVILFAIVYKQPTADMVAMLTGATFAKNFDFNNLYTLNSQKEVFNNILATNFAGLTSRFYPYVYLPHTAFFYTIFLGFNNLILLYCLYVFINLVILLLSIYLATNKKLDFTYVLVLSIFFYYSLENMLNNHFSFSLLGIALIYYCIQHKKDFWGGISTFFLFFKIHHLIFWPFAFLASNNKKEFIKGSFIMGISIFLLANLLYGTSFTFSYVNFVLEIETSAYAESYLSFITFYGLLRRADLLPILSIVVNLLTYSLIWLITAFKKTRSIQEIIIIGTLVTILFPIHTFRNDLTLLLVPISIGIVNLSNKKLLYGAISCFFIFVIDLLFPTTIFIVSILSLTMVYIYFENAQVKLPAK